MEKAWAGSLMATGIATLVMFGTRLVGITVPDAVFRAAGCVDLIALPVLGFTTIKQIQQKR